MLKINRVGMVKLSDRPYWHWLGVGDTRIYSDMSAALEEAEKRCNQ